MAREINNIDLETINFKIKKLSYLTCPKVYLSGPVSLYNDNDVALRKFIEAEKDLTDRINHGWYGDEKDVNLHHGEPFEIVNPVEINLSLRGLKDMDWGDFMTYDIALLNQCDYIYMLHDWEKSEGAKLEKLFAEKTGRIKVLHQP